MSVPTMALGAMWVSLRGRVIEPFVGNRPVLN